MGRCATAIALSCILQALFRGAVLAQEDWKTGDRKKSRVAIIGGGIAGTFLAKYLSDYDSSLCRLAAITVFDPSPIGGSPKQASNDVSNVDDPDYWQGGRVEAITLSDGTVVELGASIAYSGNQLLVDMIQSDPVLQMGKPFHTGNEISSKLGEIEMGAVPTGFGIYDGEGKWRLLLSNIPPILRKIKLFLRYNVDLWRIRQAASRAVTSFNIIYDLLESNHPATFFESPDEMWEAVGLLQPTKISFEDFLDAIGVTRELPLWRRFLPFQGSLREELLTAANLCNYNQLNSQLNGIVGLGSFLPTLGELFSIVGGNQKILSSALEQAQKAYETRCSKNATQPSVGHTQERVTTVVSDSEGMELWSGETNLGLFDVVVLAAPLQSCRISFLIRSHMDKAVLHPMPLNGMVNGAEGNNMHGQQTFQLPLPPSATRRYTQVVTTVISNATLQHMYFNVSREPLPKSIYFTSKGRDENGITAITHLSPGGNFKMFSVGKLSDAVLVDLFGPHYVVEHVKIWGGKYGGATPDYNGGDGSESLGFVLYDNALGSMSGPALFYTNAIEASFACMELSAIGARTASKLVARRLGLLATTSSLGDDEL